MAALERKQPLPKRVQEAPVLREGLIFYWSAYVHLCTERTSNGAIPWSAIRTYANEYDMGEEEFGFFYEIIRRMDSAYLGWADKQKPQDGKR